MAANQHGQKLFKEHIEEAYNMPIKAVLKMFEDQGKKIRDIAKETGFKENTVRSHARKYKVRLSNSYNPKADLHQLALDKLHEELKSERLNRVNVLSRSWQPKKTA